jgi:hypothetical protein
MSTHQEHAKRQEVVAMNGIGIAMIRRGDFASAVAELTDALSALRESVSQRHRPLDAVDFRGISVSLDQCMFQQYHQSTSNLSFHRDSEHFCGVVGVGFDDNVSSTFTEGFRTNHTFIHHQPISIPSELIDVDSSHIGMPLLSVIIIFNLSLAHQLLAASKISQKWECRDNCDRYASVRHLLIRAARLYEMSLSLLDDASGVTLFSLAVANNLGVLFAQLNEPEHATVCFQRSMSILTLLIEHKAQHHVAHFPEFLRNALLHAVGTIATGTGAA